ncbi:winged helix-turn-helix domain-containing protein, partial [Azotobacter vinelandii]|uniref:winged helix-turn-helix domain-containing protein n=3 Tax=Azotobacter vinelandii TaxID=354 RepID=UPI00091E573E
MGWRRGQAYGQDLRDRVLAAEGSIREVARRFAVSDSYMARARSRQQRGQVSAGVQCNHVPPRLQGLEGALTERVAAAPEQTLTQLCQWIEAEHGVRVSLTTMWKTLGRLGLTLKKRPRMQPSSNGRTSRQPDRDGSRSSPVSIG